MNIKFNINEDSNSVDDNIVQNTIDIKNNTVVGESIDKTINNMEDKPKLSIKEYKNLAKSDIKWKELITISSIFILISLFLSLINTVLSTNGNNILMYISVILSISTTLILSGLTCGYIQSLLNVKRQINNINLFNRFNKMIPMFIYILIYTILMFAGSVILIMGFILLFVGNILGIILILLSPIFLIIAIVFGLIYGLFPYLLIDGDNFITSLKKSRQLMKGYKGQFFILNLSFIGWYLLGLLFGGIMTLISTLPTQFMEEVSKVGVVSVSIGIIIITSLTLIPIIIYHSMTIIEFYDYRIGRQPNNVINKNNKLKLSLIIGISTLCIALIFGGSLLLPIMKTAVPSTFSIGNLSFTVTKGGISGDVGSTNSLTNALTNTSDINKYTKNDSSKKTTMPKDAKKDSTTSVTTASNTVFSFSYDIPNGYIHKKEYDYSSEYINSKEYMNDSTYEIISIREEINQAEYFDISGEYYEDIQDYSVKNKIAGKMYRVKDLDYFYFSCTHKNNIITISAANKEDLIKVLDTLKF